METFSVLTPTALSVDDMAAFLKEAGGHIIDGQVGYGCIEAGPAAVYVGIEAEKDRDWEAIRTSLPTSPSWLRSVILLTVSRGQGSIELAFQVVEKIIERWGGSISWDGLDDWEKQYRSWKAAVAQRNET